VGVFLKAAVFSQESGIELKDVEKPSPKQGEALIKVEACAICGSDLRIFNGEKTIEVPITGHEIAGTVETVGEGVSSDLVGQRATIETVIGCGKCRQCLAGFENLCLNKFKAIGYQFNGGFAQYVVLPKEAVKQGCIVPISEQLSFEEASLAEPLSCVINAFRKIDVSPQKSVAVIGAGITGILAGLYAKAKGAKVFLINRSASRLELAKQLGLDFYAFIDESSENPVEKVMELTDKQGANIVFCACSVKEPQQSALEMAAVDADISYFAGVDKRQPMNSINTNLIHYNELHVHGGNSSNKKQFEEAVQLLANKAVPGEKLITHTFPLEKLNEALSTLEDRSKNALKVVVKPWS